MTGQTEKELWWKQLVEGVAANTQMGLFPNGADRLAQIEKDIEAAGLTDLVPFTRFRTLLVNFAAKMQAGPRRSGATEAPGRASPESIGLREDLPEIRGSA